MQPYVRDSKYVNTLEQLIPLSFSAINYPGEILPEFFLSKSSSILLLNNENFSSIFEL